MSRVHRKLPVHAEMADAQGGERPGIEGVLARILSKDQTCLRWPLGHVCSSDEFPPPVDDAFLHTGRLVLGRLGTVARPLADQHAGGAEHSRGVRGQVGMAGIEPGPALARPRDGRLPESV